MRSLQLRNGRLSVGESEVPDNPDEALVRVIRSGICSTDLEITRGYAGFEGILGHEFVGVVERSSDIPDLVGKRVVGEINAGCGRCTDCLDRDPRHCPTRTVLGIIGRDGADAEYLRLPSVNLIELPERVTDDQAVFAEPLAAALGISERVRLESETRVAVVGDGKLGLLCAMWLVFLCKEVVVVGKHAKKLAIAKNAGAETMLLDDVTTSTAKHFDVVVEASGSSSGFVTSLDLVRPRGTVVLKSTFHGKPAWEASRIVVDEISIVGSRCGRLSPAVNLLAEGKVKVEPMIDSCFSLDDGLAAMARASEKGVLKVLLRS